VQIRAGGTTIPWKLIWMQQATLNRKAAGSTPARGTIPSWLSKSARAGQPPPRQCAPAGDGSAAARCM
jgi:hypothetical protein